MKTLLTDLERHKIFELSQETLWENSEDANEALSYLREQRKISDQVIKDFNFGYCPLRFKHDWAGRLIMPLLDPYGQLVIMTTRDFRTTDKEKKPHLHEQYKKQRYLFGLNVAKKNIIETNKAIITEGQFDTTCLHSFGFDMAVGLLGSSLSFDQICLLRRYCSEIYLVCDNDKAGQECIDRAMELYQTKYLEGYDMLFVPVVLPKPSNVDKIDPDEFLKTNGKDAFIEVLKNAKEKATNK